ncbi:TetR/AcrR family transcriptional regulator [bacterium]|nr:TetR/AcrR family transcriptional regulator [bacterium]
MPTAKKTQPATAEGLAAAYRRFVLLEGSAPKSIFAFCDAHGWTEADFYAHFTGFDQIEARFWTERIEATLERLKGSEEWSGFGAREKLLAFYFTWFEMLIDERSFALATAPGPGKASSARYAGWKELFVRFARELVAEGESNGEIERRSFIGERYPEALWMQQLFLLQFWSNDRSAGFEDTDAAIEKAVNLGFDLMRKGVVESAVDAFRFFARKSPMEAWMPSMDRSGNNPVSSFFARNFKG